MRPGGLVLTGSCLCGEIAVRIEGDLEHEPEACHCIECRKQSGNFLAAVNVRKTALTIGGTELVRWYRSSENIDRGFCSKCGSTLFWAPRMEGYDWIAVAMGVLDGATGARLSKHTFVGEKGDYYDIADGVPQSEEF